MDDEEFDLEEDKRTTSNETGMDKLMSFMKENSKLVIVAVVIILLLILMAAFGSGGTDKSGITISKSTITVTTETGSQVQLLKDGKEVSEVVWTSKDPTIATVDKSGVIKGVKVGKTTIIGKVNGKEYKCEVTVSEGDPSLKVESIKFSESGTILMSVGSTYQVPIQITPSEAKFKNKIFASSNPNIASIDINSGLITAKAKGNAMIRVAVNDAEKMASIKIKVVEGQVTPGIYTLPTSLGFDEKEITLTEGETKTLTYHQEPAEASTDYVMWVSADEEVATVFNGELIAKKPGNIEVAIVSMGLKDTMVVRVKAGTVDVTGINLASEENITMNVGDQKKIVATVEPSNATNQVVTYLVDNPSVVSVDSDGNISAIGSGSTTITVSPSTNLEIKKTIYVTVNEPYNGGNDSGGNDSGGSDSGGSDSGGSSGGETVTVGTVIVTGTNNSVSTELPGIEVENTSITMTGSGNVDEIRYCKYDKAVSSSCTPQTIYSEAINLPEVTLTSKTVYVFRIIPMYQGNKGQEIVRYVTIKANSSSTTPPDDGGTTPPDDGGTTPPDDGGTTPPATDDSVGTITVSGLLDRKQTADDSGVTSVTITVTRSGNVDSFKYCATTSSVECPSDSLIKKNMTNDTYSFTYKTIGNYTFYFIPYYKGKAGEQKVIKYAKIVKDTTPNPNEYHCYVSTGQTGVRYDFEWKTKPENNPNVVIAATVDTQTKCKNARDGFLCFKDSANNYYFGPNYSISSTTYTYVQGLKQEACLAKNPKNSCWCTTNGDGECIWGKKDDKHSKDSNLGEQACKNYIKDGACFVHDSGQLDWGHFMNKTGYSYKSTTSKNDCKTPITISRIDYKIRSNGDIIFSAYDNNDQKIDNSKLEWNYRTAAGTVKYLSTGVLTWSGLTQNSEGTITAINKDNTSVKKSEKFTPRNYLLSISKENYIQTWQGGMGIYPFALFKKDYTARSASRFAACYYVVPKSTKVTNIKCMTASAFSNRTFVDALNRDFGGVTYKSLKLSEADKVYGMRDSIFSNMSSLNAAVEFGGWVMTNGTKAAANDNDVILEVVHTDRDKRTTGEFEKSEVRIFRINLSRACSTDWSCYGDWVESHWTIEEITDTSWLQK